MIILVDRCQFKVEIKGQLISSYSTKNHTSCKGYDNTYSFITLNKKLYYSSKIRLTFAVRLIEIVRITITAVRLKISFLTLAYIIATT